MPLRGSVFQLIREGSTGRDERGLGVDFDLGLLVYMMNTFLLSVVKKDVFIDVSPTFTIFTN